MPRIDKRHRTRHRPQDMFDLVADVECYPEFVPMCQSLAITSRKQREGRELVIADMTMAYKMLSETFTTQVLMDPDALRIDVKYVEGPFRHLDNCWQFHPLDDGGCEIEFSLDYELKSKMLAVAAGAVFEVAFGRFVSAFEERADAVYG